MTTTTTTTTEYTLIAYKPTSSDYCRGCHMATYSSDHNVHANLSKEQLVELWADYLHKNMNLNCNEVGYSFWILDGSTMLMQEDSIDTFLENNVLPFLEVDARELARAKQNQQKELERHKAEAKAAQDALDAKQRRLQAYNQLQQEFGQGTY